MTALKKLTFEDQVATILTADVDAIYSAAATLRSRRRTQPGGRPKKMQPCPVCGLELGTRERRSHKCAETGMAPA
jgi:hypothetical protein